MGALSEPSPCTASTVRSNVESASNWRPKEKSPSDSELVEMSEVIPDRTLFTDLPRSAKPLMKKATPERPFEVLNSGTSRLFPESDPVGIWILTVEGSGSIEAITESESPPTVGAWSTLMLRARSPAADI